MIVEETVSSNQACPEDGPLAVVKPGCAVSMQPPREPFSLRKVWGTAQTCSPAHLGLLNFRPCRHRRDKSPRHWDVVAYPTYSLESGFAG